MGRSNCCLNLPYVAVLSTVIAAVGLGIWAKYFDEAHNYAVEALGAVGVSSPLLSKVKKNAQGFLIFTCLDLALLGMLALWRSALLCRRDRYQSGSSGLFKFLGGLAAIATFLVVMWTAVSLTLMGAAGATMGVGHFAAKTAGTELGKLGAAANLSAQAGKVIDAYDRIKNSSLIPDAFLQPVQSAVEALRPFVTTANETCGPFCLNLKSFKFVDVSQQCICDSKELIAAAAKAKDGAEASLGAVIGGFILLVGLVWLLMNISGQVAGACSDSWHREALKEDEIKPAHLQQYQAA